MRSTPADFLRRVIRQRCTAAGIGWVTLAGLAFAGLSCGRAEQIAAPAAGLLEVGAPLFTVHAPASLGLNSPPTDLHLMPDGRILVLAAREFALGDGTRWEVFRQAADDPPVPATGAAVAPDGEIYLAANAGFARVVRLDHGAWRAEVVAPWSGSEQADAAVPRRATVAGDDWLWHSGSGAIVRWQPGQDASIVGRADSLQHIFALDQAQFVSDRTGGALSRLDPAGMQPVAYAPRFSASDTITCSTPYAPGLVLVGTYGRGLRLFDGHTLRPFVNDGPLSTDRQVNALCPTAGAFLAAAIENLGVVFFDRTGRVVQVLDRNHDRRLARVQHLRNAPGGVVWGLTNEGVLQIEFPSRISHFEPLIGSGINIAQPFRFDGRLWIIADGTAHRAIYDDHGRMSELREDTPAGRFASNPSNDMGVFVIATERGAYRRTSEGWVEYAPDADNLRILEHAPVNGHWLYAATGQVGWIRPHLGSIALTPFPEPRLDRVYASLATSDGAIWLELGNGRTGRLRVVEDRPQIEYFGPEHGVRDSWVQVFRLDDRILFNMGDQIMSFDETSRRFVPAVDFRRRFPELSDIVGRPTHDSRGRLWITANGGVQVLEERDGVWRNVNEKMPPGFRPYYFTCQPDGVVWMHAEGRLARFDPAMPVATDPPLRALITRVEAGRGRDLRPEGATLPPLPYAENSLVAHFCAPGSGFRPVRFEVWLEGGSAGWMPVGHAGSAVFNDLREGEYRLHVRPRHGAMLGAESTLAFEVLPPWYRTLPAYGGYALALLGLAALGGRVLLTVQRREQAALERLVAQRTRELHASNERLAAQLEQNQILSKAIEQSPAAIYIIDRQDRIIFANPRAHELNGRVETGLVGQPLSAFRASSVTPELFQQIHSTVTRGETWRGQLANRRADGRVFQLRSIIAPIRHGEGEAQHYLVLEEDVTESLNEQERRRRLEAQLIQAQKLESIGTLAGGIAHDFNNILTAILGYCELAGLDAPGNEALQGDLAGIRSAATRAKELVARILTFSRQTHVQLVPLDLAQPVAEAVKLVRASSPSTVQIVATLQSGTIRADATQIQQIVLNLCTNALQALPNQRGKIEVTVQPVQVSAEIAAEVDQLWVGDAMRLVISDDGCGMDAATLRRIFDPFFTTKPQGEGTGLGLAIVQGVVTGHQGAIRVRSTAGMGTTFEIYFPPSTEVSSPPTPDSPAPRGDQQEIIVVDDERSVANFVATRLHQLGYRPMVFCDPQAALNAFAAQPTRFHAIVTDLTMPYLTGADLIRQIRSRGWLIPAVIITGYQGDAVRANVQAFPRCLVVPKPFSGDDLGRALHQVINDYTVKV